MCVDCEIIVVWLMWLNFFVVGERVIGFVVDKEVCDIYNGV